MTDDIRRNTIESLLKAGLMTEAQPRADTHEAVQDVISRLRNSDGAISSKLIIGGVTLDPVLHDAVEQACETCMYYLVHRRYCELPELNLPVGPRWSCRLWRS